MTDNEIMECAENCLSVIPSCISCPFDEGTLTVDECMNKLIEKLVEVVNRQKAELSKKDTEIDILIRKKENLNDEISELKAEIDRLQKLKTAKCGTCAYAKPTTFGKSKCYVECTNREHIEQYCRYRKISLKRQRTTPACKNYKEMTEGGEG